MELRRDRAVHERNLRRDVTRFAGCLEALPGVEGPLLSIRAGIGSAEPASLRQAARQLGISTRRAARVERRALLRLRAAGRSGACGSGAAAARRGVALGTTGGSIPPLQPTLMLAARPRLTSPVALARSAGKGRERTLPLSQSEGSTKATEARAPAAVPTANASSKTGAYLAALAILALLLAALVMAWRRREHAVPARLGEQTGTAAVWWPPGPAEPPTGPPEPPPVAVEAVATVDTPAAGYAVPADQSPGAQNGSDEEDAPAEPPAAAPASPEPASRPSHRRRPRPAVVAASLLSVGVALLRRRRR